MLLIETKNIVNKKQKIIPTILKDPQLIKEPYNLKQSLLPLELLNLQLAIKFNRPFSTREMYVGVINNFFKSYFFQIVKNKNEIINIKDPLLSKLRNDLPKILQIDINEVNIIFTGIYFELINLKIPYMEHKGIHPFFKTRMTDLEITIDTKYSRMSETDRIRIKEKILSYYKVKFPSYLKILNILNSLEALQMLSKRYESGKKANFYWILNIQFVNKFQNKFNEIINL